MSLLNVHYLGDDPDFTLSISNFIQSKNLKVKLSTSLLDPIALCMSDAPSVVYVDFTSIKEVEGYIKQVNFLKKILRFRSVLFVALFKDEDHLKDYDYIFTSGFQFSFIKGGEYLSLFRDSIFIAADEKVSYPNYAEAKNLYRKLKVGVCSTATEMSLSGLLLETDVDIARDSLGLSLRIFPDLTEVEVLDSSETTLTYPMTTTFEVKFPEEDPWGDDGKFSLCTETVETWIDLHKEDFIKSKGNVVVIQASLEGLLDTFLVQKTSGFGSYFYETIEDAVINLGKSLPDLIFLEVDDHDEQTNSLQKVQYFTDCVRSIEGYHPVLILLNIQATSTAVQKLVNYSRIVCSKDKYDGILLSKFIDLYIKKAVQSQEDISHVFSPISKMRVIDVNLDIILNKMTEHEVVFRCEEALPMFSILHFLQPVEFYATLVPPFFERPELSDVSSRTAIIHGVSEKKLEQLRKFVNALILNPNLSFDMVEVSEINRQDEVVIAKEEESLMVPVKEIKVDMQIKKPRFKGKSKL